MKQWIVDGQKIVAERLDLVDGHLVFYTKEGITFLAAPGAWQFVDGIPEDEE